MTKLASFRVESFASAATGSREARSGISLKLALFLKAGAPGGPVQPRVPAGSGQRLKLDLFELSADC